MNQLSFKVSGPAIREPGAEQKNGFAGRQLLDDKTGMIVNNRYLLDRIIGKGGFGSVYLATDMHTDKTVAIKFRDNPHISSLFGEKRITSEISSLSRVEHRNVVSMKGAGICNKESYIVMEYLEGMDLEEYLREKKLAPYHETAPIISQICSGLGALHNIGIIHRDVKPRNVFLLTDWTVKIFDFDLSHFAGSEQPEPFEHRPGSVCGTASYLSPEAILGQIPDHRADIYAVGVIMYRMLCGELPITGGTRAHLITRIVDFIPVPPCKRNPLVPPIADRIVMRALEKDPAHRFQSMFEMRDALVFMPYAISIVRPIRPVPLMCGPDDPCLSRQMTRSFRC